LDLQIKSYGETKVLGEIWARQACIGANQQELTTHVEKYEQEEDGYLLHQGKVV
jgi:hypothetical protein